MDLVMLEKNKPVTTSLIIAKGVKTEHHSVITLIRKHTKSLQEFGTVEFQIRKSGGRPLEFAILNEEQTTFLITCMRNTEIVIEFKIKLVKEFYKMNKTLIIENIWKVGGDFFFTQRVCTHGYREEEFELITDENISK